MKSMQHHLIPSSAQRVELFHNSVSEYRQSYSGSETDVSTSTSTENLSHEEKYVLQTSKRQEPQGEENVSCNRSMDQSSISSFNTLIIHKNSGSDECYGRGNFLANMDDHHQANLKHYHCGMGNMQVPSSPQVGLRRFNNLSKSSHSTRGKKSSPYGDNIALGSQASNSSLQHEMMADIPKLHLDPSSMLLTHGMKESGGECFPHEMNILPPPPAYPNYFASDVSRHFSALEKSKKFSMSRSQPDLTQEGLLGSQEKQMSGKQHFYHQRPRTRGRATVEKDHNIITAQKAEMIELLIEENFALKTELENYYSKVAKLQKFEVEIEKVYQSYGELEKSSEKRDVLSRAVRMKMEVEIKRLQDMNKHFKAQLDVASSQLYKKQSYEIDDSELTKELNRRDLLIAQLITQNKELVASKERQEIELAAQRATLQEQRTHIDILDSALTNAQGNVVKLEEECRKKQVYVERVGQLQKALASLQVASDKREQMEKKLRNQLEKEIQELRTKKDERLPNKETNQEEITQLKQQLRENEERMMAMQGDVAKWEQRYLEESALRQIAIDAASMPKDAKIAALEQTSHESERLIAQARTDKLKQMDELHAINKRCADFEGRIKDLESKLAEKEAMIKVLQKHSLEKDVAYQNAILRSPRHTPHPSLHEKNFLASSADINESAASANVASLTTTISTLSITNTTASFTAKTAQALEEGNANVDEQLKDLDSQVLSKDSIIQALRAEKEKYPNHFWRV